MTVGPYSHDAEQLAELRHHWDTAYVIEQTGPSTWLAARRDGRGAVHASSADELFAAISADYREHPVPRDGDES
jgi:hypothetical protein